jgi:hypothetical protein
MGSVRRVVPALWKIALASPVFRIPLAIKVSRVARATALPASVLPWFTFAAMTIAPYLSNTSYRPYYVKVIIAHSAFRFRPRAADDDNVESTPEIIEWRFRYD